MKILFGILAAQWDVPRRPINLSQKVRDFIHKLPLPFEILFLKVWSGVCCPQGFTVLEDGTGNMVDGGSRE